MKCHICIDLVSNNTNAVLLDQSYDVLGHGITNSRSNYETAVTVAKREARTGARLTLFRRGLERAAAGAAGMADFMDDLELQIRLEQFLEQLEDLRRTCASHVAPGAEALREAVAEVFARIAAEAPESFQRGAQRKSEFVRDIAGSRVRQVGEEVA